MFRNKRPHVPQPHLRWKYLPIRSGEKYQLWAAGRSVGAWLHWVGSSKPCTKKMTSDRQPCGLCSQGEEPIWRGYLPCYTNVPEQVVILFTVDYYEIVQGLDLYAPLLASRGKGGRDPVKVVNLSDKASSMRWAGEPRPAADITPWLLRLWKSPPFEAALAADAANNDRPDDDDDRAPSVPPPPKRPAKEEHYRPAPKELENLRQWMRGNKKVESPAASPSDQPPAKNGKHP